MPAPESAPRHNLTGDPYFTDGLRAVLVLSPELTEPAFLGWSKELLVAGSGPGRQK